MYTFFLASYRIFPGKFFLELQQMSTLRSAFVRSSHAFVCECGDEWEGCGVCVVVCGVGVCVVGWCWRT